MKLLITSGGTSEKIDHVRSITNHASGHLGKILVEQALARGHQVTLVTSKSAVRPAPHDQLETIEITDVAHLKDTLEPLVKTHEALIHSMAVADYTPVYMAGLEEVKKGHNLDAFLDKRNTERKISSKEESQVLFLKKTPKIISFIKQWNPTIHLIGFKLLVDVPKEELFSVARESLKKNQADYIFANDLIDITSNQHIGYLVNQTTEIKAQTKEDIALLLLNKLEEDHNG